VGHIASVDSMAFMPDNKGLISGIVDGGGGDKGLWVQRDPSGTKRTGEGPGHVTRIYSEPP
jgi:hypothetical protein